LTGTGSVDPLGAVIGREVVSSRTLVGGLEPGTEVVDVELVDCVIDGGVLARTTWRRCTLDSCRVTAADLSMSELIDVRLADCSVEDSKARAVSWAGLRAGALAQRSVWFERCRLDYGSFQGVDVRGMRFGSCSLVDADFSGADCRRVEFVDCDLSGARFAGADLRGALLSGVRGLSLDVREARTHGLRVDPPAALDLVAALGIDIVDPPFE
jgi:fluoroquinolone resistance protein